MKTYKQLLQKKYWRVNVAVGVSFFAVILFLILSSKVEYAFLLFLVIFVSSLFGGLKCPNCKTRLNTPPGPRGFDRVNFCGGCGFDLNQDAANKDQKQEAGKDGDAEEAV